MDIKQIKLNKGNSSISTTSLINNIVYQNSNKLSDVKPKRRNQLKINSNISENKIHVFKPNQQKISSPSFKNIKYDKKVNDKNDLVNENLNYNNNLNDNSKKKNITKKIKNKFTRTFSGCGYKRKCSLNNKGTFNMVDIKLDIRQNSKDGGYYLGNSLISNDAEILKEFNTTNINANNLNNYSYKKKNKKYNLMITMTNYQQKEKDKYIKKITNEEVKNDKVDYKENTKNNSKKRVIKTENLKCSEDIIENNDNNFSKKTKLNNKGSSKKRYDKKLLNLNINKEEILTNDNNKTIEDNNHNEKKIIKIRIIESFKQKNANNNKNNYSDKEELKKKVNNSVGENKNNKKSTMTDDIKSNKIEKNHYNRNHDHSKEIISKENSKKYHKLNSCLKKSKNFIINLNQKSNSNNKNSVNNIKKINQNERKSNNNKKDINIELKGTESAKQQILNVRTISCSNKLKSTNNSCKNYIKINNKYNNYFSYNYSTLTNRIKLSLNMAYNKNTFNNIKHSLIRNIKNKLVDENNFKNNNLLFILNILSNWGNKKQIGITGIEVFDVNNQKIKIKECKVEGGSNEHLERLFNDKIYTINENDMWLSDINTNNSYKNLNLKLYFYISNYVCLESINNINIYNYNGWELNKSIKKIEILTKDEDVIFNGIVPKGDYNIKCFHPYIIRINKKILLKRNKNKIYQNTHFLYNSYKHDTEQSFDINYISCNNSLLSKKAKLKNEIKNNHYPLLKHSSMNYTRKCNGYNFIKVKSSRSCNKNRNNHFSFINNDFMNNFSEKKNNDKKFVFNKIKSIKKVKNNSFIYEKDQTYPNEFEKPRESYGIKIKNRKNPEYLLSTIKLEKNNSLNNIKSFDSSNIPNLNNFNTINGSYNNASTKKRISMISTVNNTISFKSKQTDNIKNKLKYIIFKKIRINILSNYGNSYIVGLTGLNLIDKDNKLIDIESAIAVGALPKDLKTIYYDENEDRIFENLFNGINNTTNENLMWLTLLNPRPFIEICFKDEMTLNRIEIWNFNEPMSLDKGAKNIEIIFDDNENRKYNIILWKGLGIDHYDYFQKIYFDKCEDSLNLNYLKFNNKNRKLPIGFAFKLIFISNFGDKEMISLKKFELYNEKNNLLSKYTIIADNFDEITNHKNASKNNLERIQNYFYFHKLFDFRKDEDSICNNLLFICFNEIVQIKYIKLENISTGKLKYTSTKTMQIYCDDVLIFEGDLKQNGENIILFDEKEIKKFNNVINLNIRKTKYKFTEKIKGDVCRLVNMGSCYE